MGRTLLKSGGICGAQTNGHGRPARLSPTGAWKGPIARRTPRSAAPRPSPGAVRPVAPVLPVAQPSLAAWASRRVSAGPAPLRKALCHRAREPDAKRPPRRAGGLFRSSAVPPPREESENQNFVSMPKPIRRGCSKKPSVPSAPGRIV